MHRCSRARESCCLSLDSAEYKLQMSAKHPDPCFAVPHAPCHMKVPSYLHEIQWLVVLYVPLFLAKSPLALMCSTMLLNAVIP